jgi:chaperonin cofactor prefoldin
MSEELQQRTESLRRMVETRDLTIKDLEREIRELRAALNGTLTADLYHFPDFGKMVAWRLA